MCFTCIVHVDPDSLAALGPFERENQTYADWLVSSGHSVICASLHEPETATVIRSSGGRVSMTDGPYVETKEHVGGIMVIRARDRDEALAVASRSPVARHGTLELRAMNAGE